MEAVRLYPKAVMFSLAFSTAVIMEGYDLSLVGSFFGFPQFKNRYGTERDADGNLVIGATWQSAINNGVQASDVALAAVQTRLIFISSVARSSVSTSMVGSPIRLATREQCWERSF